MAKLKVVKKKKEEVISPEEKVKAYLVPRIRKYLTKYEGLAITPMVAIELTTFIKDLVDDTHELFPDIDREWLMIFTNLLSWGFSGAIVITPEQEDR